MDSARVADKDGLGIPLGFGELYDGMTEEERHLYTSAFQVRKSLFWNHLLDTLDELTKTTLSDMTNLLLTGRPREATSAAGRVEGYNWLLQQMDTIMTDLLRMSQEQGLD